MNMNILVGYTFVLFLPEIVCHNCTVTHSGIEAHIDCTNRNLRGVPSDLPISVTTLDISNNELGRLSNYTFVNYSMLVSLIINNNSLRVLEEEAFFGLEKLKNLSMNSNNLNQSDLYPQGIFRHLKSLEKLDIRWNLDKHFYTIPVMYPYFGDLITLTDWYIDLSSQPNFTQTGLYLLSRLRVVRFDHCVLRELSIDTFNGFPASVIQLYISNDNSLASPFEVKTQEALKHFPSLKVLSLNNIYCQLSKALELLFPFANKSMEAIIYRKVYRLKDTAVYLSTNMTSYLVTICVKTLVLAENWIADFEPEALFGHRHPECLENVILTGNRFMLLSDDQKSSLFLGTIPYVTNLKVFDYSFNPVKYPKVSYMDLQYLDTAHQETHVLQPNTKIAQKIYDQQTCISEKNTVKKEMNLHTNTKIAGVMDVPAITITMPKQLETLRLSHLLRHDGVGNRSYTIHNASNLRKVDISYCQIDRLVGIHFIDQTKIEYLDVSGINSDFILSKTTLSLFENATTIVMQSANLGQTLRLNSTRLPKFIKTVEKLDISGNNIWFMDEETFTKSKHLKHLDMSKNILMDVPMAVTHIKLLQTLDLRFNLLQTINETIRTWLDSREKLKRFRLLLKGNIFECNCGTAEFVKWLFQTKIVLDDNKREYKCRLENGSHSNTLFVYKEYHDLFKYCESSMWLQVGIWLVSSFIFILTIAAVIFNFRLHILYWFYKTFKMAIQREIKQKFEYDIYLSYASDMYPWVKNVFASKVEESWKMKICIEDRDILAGTIYSDSVAMAIKESRYIVFILSKEFENREWGWYEIERAKFEKFTRNVQTIILIIKDTGMLDLPIKQLENLWKDVLIINWSDSDNEKGWNELRMAMFSEPI